MDKDAPGSTVHPAAIDEKPPGHEAEMDDRARILSLMAQCETLTSAAAWEYRQQDDVQQPKPLSFQAQTGFPAASIDQMPTHQYGTAVAANRSRHWLLLR